MDLEKYRRIISKNTKRPSDNQINSFVEYVCNAHSWYKHLPCIGNGIPFHFFINPVAGYRLTHFEASKSIFTKKGTSEKFFHYNEMPTKLYNDKFASLDFFRTSGSKIYFTQNNCVIDNNRNEFDAYLPDGTMIPMPIELRKVSDCIVNSCIHDNTNSSWLVYSYQRRVDDSEKQGLKRRCPRLYNLLDKLPRSRATFARISAYWNESEMAYVEKYIQAERVRLKSKMKSVLQDVVEYTY